MTIRTLASASAFALATHFGCAEPVLTGIMMLPEGPRFCLVDDQAEDGESPASWVVLGGSFQGYKLEAFDHEREVLILRRGDDVRRVVLRQAKIEPLPEPPPEPGLAQAVEDLSDVPNEELHERSLHRIEKGETLASISQQTGVSIRQIFDANKGLSPINLTVGRILSLRPGVVPPRQPARPVSPPAPEESSGSAPPR